MAHVLIKFTVEGTGTFPFDMLRRDSCFPTDSESAGNLNQPHYKSNGFGKPRTVSLAITSDRRSHKPNEEIYQNGPFS